MVRPYRETRPIYSGYRGLIYVRLPDSLPDLRTADYRLQALPEDVR